jgi:hypothetical protein
LVECSNRLSIEGDSLRGIVPVYESVSMMAGPDFYQWAFYEVFYCSIVTSWRLVVSV